AFAEVVEQVGGQRRRLVGHHQEGFAALFAYQRIRVFAVGQEQEARLLAVLECRQGGFQRTPGGAAAGVVAVETEHHFIDLAEQFYRVFFGGGGAEGGD